MALIWVWNYLFPLGFLRFHAFLAPVSPECCHHDADFEVNFVDVR
jgi:hypothetical protein